MEDLMECLHCGQLDVLVDGYCFFCQADVPVHEVFETDGIEEIEATDEKW